VQIGAATLTTLAVELSNADYTGASLVS